MNTQNQELENIKRDLLANLTANQKLALRKIKPLNYSELIAKGLNQVELTTAILNHSINSIIKIKEAN